MPTESLLPKTTEDSKRQEKLAPYEKYISDLLKTMGIVESPTLREKLENQIFEAIKAKKKQDIPLILGRTIIIENQKALVAGAQTMFDINEKNGKKEAQQFVKKGTELVLGLITAYLAEHFPLPTEEKTGGIMKLWSSGKPQSAVERYAEQLKKSL